MSMAQQFLTQYQQQLQKDLQDKQLPQRILLRYDIESCIAHNPEKEMYIVRRKSDGKAGLLRITKGRFPEDTTAEAEILTRLEHPAIPTVFEWFVENDRSYLIREYFDGQTLGMLVRKHGPFPPKQVLEIAGQLCDILRYLHGQALPVIHRDIKPENIIIDSGGALKLIDFGIARIYRHDGAQDTQVLGTALFAPPEQFGYQQTGTHSDIYSLGMVLLFLATGDVQRDTLRAIPHRGLRKLIAKCIAFSPKDRFKNADRLHRGIRRLQRWWNFYHQQ